MRPPTLQRYFWFLWTLASAWGFAVMVGLSFVNLGSTELVIAGCVGAFLAVCLAQAGLAHRLKLEADRSYSARDGTGLRAGFRELSQGLRRVSEQHLSREESIGQIMAYLKEVTSEIERSLASASQSEAGVTMLEERSRKNAEMIQSMIQKLDELQERNVEIIQQVNEGHQKVSGVMGFVKNIEEKTRIIDEIVFQTKLLSFNAAVEAARAGEHGKGFAVVAQEIGNLAQMSGQAAREIAAMLMGGTVQVEQVLNITQVQTERMVEESKEHGGTEHAFVAQLKAAADEMQNELHAFHRSAQDLKECAQKQRVSLGHFAELFEALAEDERSGKDHILALVGRLPALPQKPGPTPGTGSSPPMAPAAAAGPTKPHLRVV